MLLMNKTLLKFARGLWGWIISVAALSFLMLIGTTALSEIVAGFLGNLFEPQKALDTVLSNAQKSRYLPYGRAVKRT